MYEVAAGGTTEDPALAYDTVSAEPILNVYETLINYNGTSTDTYVPTLATCIPGSAQCVSDYGTNLTAGFNSSGVPEYWTFVIDPSAHFFDPTTDRSWSVYPSDVMFSLARTMAFTDIPYVAKTAGWIMSQSLLQYGNPGWDAGIHFVFNNTPNNILSSMLINDSTYCTAKMMDGVHGNGCVTFVANGSGQLWPYFLQFVVDNLGASVVPCGWFTAQGAGLPGWSGSAASGGDGPCLLPDGGTTTSGAAWASYLTGLSPTAWDTLEEQNALWPATQPNVQWSLVGSGPYAAAITVGTGYQLEANPDYAQPSGCSGVNGLAALPTPNYCDPIPGRYQSNVYVFWEPSDAFGVSRYNASAADFAAIEAVHTPTLVDLAAEGKLHWTAFPTLSDSFTGINFAFNEGTYAGCYPSEPAQTIPETAFSNLGLRNFYVDSYPYLTVENTLRTVDGIPYSFNVGGPIPYGMGDYYPANISFPGGDPYHPSHDPDTNPADVGGAAWWWAQLHDLSSPYYDAKIANCSRSSPCTWAIAGVQGDPSDDAAITDWIGEIQSLTGGALKMFEVVLGPVLNWPDYCDFGLPYDSPLVSQVGTGWAPDYADPSDYITPTILPDSTYTASDTVGEQLSEPNYDNVALCGHADLNYSNLLYWAHAANNLTGGAFDGSCQGVAYHLAVGYANIATLMPVSPTRVLDYNLVEQITNRLAMYVWNGQPNEVESAAPWIQLSSINQNPMIGGGGDQPWFQIQYQNYTPITLYNVTFAETGLPLGTSWSVGIGEMSLEPTTGTTLTYQSGNGTIYYSFNATAAGYGAYKVTGQKGMTYGSAHVQGGPITVRVFFAPLEMVYFNETGLANGTTWSVNVTDTSPNGPAGGTASGIVNGTQNGSFSFRFPAGAHLTYTVVKPGTYRALGGHGAFTVPRHAFSRTIRFALFTAKITFLETGLPAKSSWSVNLVDWASGFNQTITSSTSAIKFLLANGTYVVSVAKVGRYAAVVVGSITVFAPHAQSVQASFTDPGPPTGPPRSGDPVASPIAVWRER